MSTTRGVSPLSIFAGALVGVVVGLGTQITMHLRIYGGEQASPFRFLLDSVTVPLFVALLALVVVLFTFQLIRQRKVSNFGLAQRIRWFSLGAILAGVLGLLVVNLIVGLRMSSLDPTYGGLIFFVAGIVPFGVSLVVFPLGLLVAKGIAQISAARTEARDG